MVANEGVRNFGWMVENFLGNKPSRLMLIQMRGCPSWNTSSTLAMATIALTAMMPESQCRFSFWNTKASGSPTASSWYGTMPVSTSAIAT